MNQNINQHIELGIINTLLIDRITEPGIFLVALDGEAVLLPNRYVTPQMKVYDKLEVFIYTDSEDRLIATTAMPLAMANQFGYFKVVDSARFGAFVDIGLMKDLFVPKNMQKSRFEIGDKRILRVIVDQHTNRLIGDERIIKYLLNDTSEFQQNQEVDILVFAKTDLGFKVIVNHNFEGLIYANEVFGKLKVGDSQKGYIKNIREDGKIDISLQPIGAIKKDLSAQKVIEVLQKNSGKIGFCYKSEAEDIYKAFGLSKKSFKAALTTLINDKLIKLEDCEIELI